MKLVTTHEVSLAELSDTFVSALSDEALVKYAASKYAEQTEMPDWARNSNAAAYLALDIRSIEAELDRRGL